jgi:hypothetical protein
MTRTNSWRGVACLAVVLIVDLAAAQQVLPTKSFNIEGGIVSAFGGVMQRPPDQAAPFGNMKYPTRYFIALDNESPNAIWVDTVWTFPDTKQDKSRQPKSVESVRIAPGSDYWFYFDRFGVIAERPIAIGITAYADESRKNPIGAQDAEFLFAQPDVDAFIASFQKPFARHSGTTAATVISGWHDLPAPRTDVAGTLANEELQADVQSSIWKFDSAKRWSCERKVLSATSTPADQSLLLARLPLEGLESAKRGLAEGKVAVETWRVRSCGHEIPYEVLLSASPGGGTDVLVMDVSVPALSDAEIRAAAEEE